MTDEQKKTKVWNFGAGPALLPRPVLEKAQQEMLDYAGTGMSVMELSHRSSTFDDIHQSAKNRLRHLLKVPANYHILFMQGGATLQFSSIVMNLCTDYEKDTTDYVVTGTWSEKAAQEAKRLFQHRPEAVQVVLSTKATQHNGQLPLAPQWQWQPKGGKRPSFIYYCDNETVHGVEWPASKTPLDMAGSACPYENAKEIPLVCDVSSNFLSRPIDVNRFALIYGGAQKNIGPAGVTIVIVRDDLLEAHRKRLHKHTIPVMLDYLVQADNDSLYNTPPTYGIYIAGLVFEWMQNMFQNLENVAARNEAKAKRVYDLIESSHGFYQCAVVEPQFRSKMNIPFRICLPNGQPDPKAEKEFLARAETLGMVQLAGHRSVGGIRVSVYNAMPEEGVEFLVACMKQFQQEYQTKY